MNTLEDCDLQTRKELVRRVASSSLICKSARLRELFLYLGNKVLDESVYDIYELELGHKFFGRPQHYDAAADNILRVDALLLRKRLAEYFQTEGINEALIVEIPRGNYAATLWKRGPLPILSDGLERPETLVFQPDFGLLEPKNSPRQQLPANSSSGMRVSKPLTGSFLALGRDALIAYLLVRTIDQSPQHGKQPLASMSQLRSPMNKTNAKENDGFPYFETLLRLEKGASLSLIRDHCHLSFSPDHCAS
jgi:hypothetical protein